MELKFLRKYEFYGMTICKYAAGNFTITANYDERSNTTLIKAFDSLERVELLVTGSTEGSMYVEQSVISSRSEANSLIELINEGADLLEYISANKKELVSGQPPFPKAGREGISGG